MVQLCVSHTAPDEVGVCRMGAESELKTEALDFRNISPLYRNSTKLFSIVRRYSNRD